jgi:hypothetical protein
MKGNARLLAVIADVYAHLELLPHHCRNSHFALAPQLGCINRLTLLLTQ